MAVSRVIEVSFGRSSVALVRVNTAYFYNNGIIFKPTDLDLPASYQVHWADSPDKATTLETIGTAEGAPIPDDLWDRSRVIYGWIYLHPTEDSGVTAYEVRIYKNVRAGLPDGTEPTPAEQSTIDQLISALNGAVEQAEDAQEAIENMSVSATTLAEGESATVTKSEQDGVVHLAFGIPKGATGDDGYSPTADVSKTGKVATITITDKNGTTSAQVEDGEDGIDGISPSVSVTDITGGHRVVITDKDGTKSFDVEDGATGATPNLTIGTVTTLEPDASATASITGTAEDPVLNLGIPRGQTGEVTEEEFTQLKEDFSELRYIEPTRINGVEFSGNLLTYCSRKIENKYAYTKTTTSPVKFGNNSGYDTFVIPVEPNKTYSMKSVNYWALVDKNNNTIIGCTSSGTNITSLDTTQYPEAAYFYFSNSRSDSTPFIRTADTDPYGVIEWLKVTDDNIKSLGLLKDEPIPPDKLRDAENYGDLIQYQGAEIIESKYTWGTAGSKVNTGNSNNYNYVVISVVPDKVYRFNTVSWWAVTDDNDIVVLGCGRNGTSTNSVDTTGIENAKKLYVSIPKSATQVYVIDNNDGIVRFEWSLDGFVATDNNNVFDIPDFKYITDKAWNMFFSGAWLRDAEYRRTSWGYEQFDNHFSYKSTSAGFVNNAVKLYDNNFDELGTHIVHVQYATPNYRNLSALFIGDSTINNGRLTAKVLEVFSDNNVTCTLLGTTGSGDNKREGRSGWSANDYCGKTTRGQDTAQNPFYNPTSEAFDFSYYMTNQGYSAPDFVFIQLGINDMFTVSLAGFDTAYNAFKTNMLAIVNSIHDYNANIKIVVNLITMPNGNISAFNTLYGCNYYNWERRYVDIKTNHNLISDLPSYVIVNPHNLILDPMTHIIDDVHPTADGYGILGEFDADIMFAN